MMELLHATDTRLGLVTNGEQWMLVDAPKGETTGFASWYANLWFEEPLTLRAFRSLLGVHRFFSAADDETVESMLKESASNQQEVTDRLGYQVREAVEVIIRSLDRIDQDEKGRLLSGVSESELYEAALTVMMRLVFLFSAEERGLLLLGDPLYDEHYAVSTLVAKLQEAADQHGEEVLERRHDAWVRLLSAFRAVFGGVQHERMKLLPYAGRLFDPDRFPFLEGRRTGTTWSRSWTVDREPWTVERGPWNPPRQRDTVDRRRPTAKMRRNAMAIQSFRELEVWQVGMDLAVECYRVTKAFPREELFGMTSQIRRSAVSVPANIAEGQGREHTKEFLHHLSISRGSLMELETHLLLSQRVDLITEPALDPLMTLCERVSQMTSRLQQALQKRR
jgi:four helix bundle protein